MRQLAAAVPCEMKFFLHVSAEFAFMFYRVEWGLTCAVAAQQSDWRRRRKVDGSCLESKHQLAEAVPCEMTFENYFAS